MMEHRQIETTADGSPTIRLPGQNLTYHSHHGAVQESRHVFVQAGLENVVREKSELRILEMGLGTGLNVLATAQTVMNRGLALHYTALEKHPLQAAEWQSLSYAQALDWPGADAVLQALHAQEWNRWATLQPDFQFRKLEVDLLTWQPDDCFDLIYYDAFAPVAQPELWTEEVFAKLFGAAAHGAWLATYCSKGVVRRAMQAAGWQVHKLPGPKGKREMVVARRA